MPSTATDQVFVPFERRAAAMVRSAMRQAAVVLLDGPRGAGKSQLLGALHRASRHGTAFDLSHTIDSRLAQRDPAGLLAGHDRPIFVDELQRADRTFLTALAREAARPGPGGPVVVCGGGYAPGGKWSTAVEESGALRRVPVWPLSQGEIDGAPDGLVDRAFRSPASLGDIAVPTLSRREVFERVCRGGFPAAVTATGPKRRAEVHAALLDALVADVFDLISVAHPDTLEPIARLLAESSGRLLSQTEIGRPVDLMVSTISRHLRSYRQAGFFQELPAWPTGISANDLRRPRSQLTDSGLAAYLIGATPAALAAGRGQDAERAEALLRTFVIGEITRQIGWSRNRVAMHWWWPAYGPGVDLLLEDQRGRVVAFVVTTSEHPDDVARTARGFTTIRRAIGRRFLTGVLLHCGSDVGPIGPHGLALPVTALWHTPSG